MSAKGVFEPSCSGCSLSFKCLLPGPGFSGPHIHTHQFAFLPFGPKWACLSPLYYLVQVLIMTFLLWVKLWLKPPVLSLQSPCRRTALVWGPIQDFLVGDTCGEWCMESRHQDEKDGGGNGSQETLLFQTNCAHGRCLFHSTAEEFEFLPRQFLS